MDAPSWIHVGVWTNWADGLVEGAKITVHEVHAAYLVAFLALFVRLTGQHSWDICCYLLFRLRRSHQAQDNLYQGQQTILRNTITDTSAVWQFLHLGWAQRKYADSALQRSAGYVLFSLVHLAAFTAAGIFVSQVADGGSQVLIRGPTCGVWHDPGAWEEYVSGSPADSLENNRFGSWIAEISLQASRFSQSCYNDSTSKSGLANCEAFGPNLITWNVSTDIPCPFDEQMCTNGSVRFDSGFLDSQLDFGINTKPQDRVKYRRVVECAPIQQTGFSSPLLDYAQVHLPPPGQAAFTGSFQGSETFQEFNYGMNTDYDMNSTFIWVNTTVGPHLGNFATSSYLIDGEIATLQNDVSSTFSPIEEMNRTDADVVMYFLLNVAAFLGPVYDPWFEATDLWNTDEPSIILNVSADSNPYYRPNKNVSVMGCTQQFQYCNHDASKCSELTGSARGGNVPQALLNFQDGLDLNPRQQSIQSRIYQASWLADMYYANDVPEGQNLLASSYSTTGLYSPVLPDNQWILEMQHFFLLGLTSMQIQLSQYATGPDGSYNYPYLTPPTESERWMCDNQIVQRAGYTTFSVLGISLILSIGCVIILINLLLTNSAVTISRASKAATGPIRPQSKWDRYYNLNLLYTNFRTHVPTSDERSEDLTPTMSEPTSLEKPISRGKDQELKYGNDFSRDVAGVSDDRPRQKSGMRSMLRMPFKRSSTAGVVIT